MNSFQLDNGKEALVKGRPRPIKEAHDVGVIVAILICGAVLIILEITEIKVGKKTNYVSVNSKPDHPPPGDPRGFAHSSCPKGRVLLFCLARGSARGGLKSKFDNFETKSSIFALSLKQLSSSTFHMFIHARSEQRDLAFLHLHYNKYKAYQNLSR